jgi:hypothetical protein
LALKLYWDPEIAKAFGFRLECLGDPALLVGG